MPSCGKSIFYIGSYSEYIYVMELDREKEEIRILNRTSHCSKPSYLSIDAGGKHLYSNNEISNSLGGVSAYDISDKLAPRYINSISFNASGPCHISLSEDRHTLLSASYADGIVYANPINPDGSLGGCSAVIKHENGDPLRKGLIPGSQSQARAHFICQVPGTHYVLATDLGADRVYVYILEEGKLITHSVMQTASGAGPRHLVIHPCGSIVYLINELDNMVNVLDFNKSTGVLNNIQQLSALPSDFQGTSYCSAIHISKDGRFLYGANRGCDSIAVFTINEKDYSITSAGFMALPQKTPRDFAIDPSGRYMLVGNLDSDSVSLCRVLAGTGIPEIINHTCGIEKPSNFQFID